MTTPRTTVAPSGLPASTTGQLFQNRSGSVIADEAPIIRAKDHGVTGDVLHDNTVTFTSGSNVVTGSAGIFTAGDVGKKFTGIVGGSRYSSTISSYVSATVVHTTANSTINGSGECWWGTDQSTALQALIDSFPQAGTQGRAQVGGTIQLEAGHVYCLGATTIQTNTRRGIRIVGGGGRSALEGSAYGTSIVSLTPNATIFEADGSTGAVENGTQFEHFNIREVAGGTRGIYIKALNRCRFDDMTFNRVDIGIEFDAVAQDCAHHWLGDCHFIECGTGILGTDHFGFVMVGGEFFICGYGYKGLRDRHTAFVGVHGVANTVGWYSRGTNMKWVDCYHENATGVPSVAWDIDALEPDAGSTGWGPGCAFFIDGCAAYGGGIGDADTVGLRLGPGVQGGTFNIYVDSMITANLIQIDPAATHDVTIRPNTKTGYLPDEIINGMQKWYRSASPEGVITAPIGSQYTDTATGTQYVKVSGSGNTGWAIPGQSAAVDPKTTERVLSVAITGALGATITDGADVPIAAPFRTLLKRMKVTTKTAPSGAMVAQLRRSTNAATPSYADVGGFAATFVSAHQSSVVDPADFALDEGDLLNISVATGSGTNLLAELILAERPPAPAYVQDIGSATDTNVDTAILCTTTNPVAAGNTAVLVFLTGGTSPLLSVSGGGVAWRIQGSSTNPSSPTVSIATAYCANGMPSGSVITASIATVSANKGVYIAEFSHLASTPDDVIATRNGGPGASSLSTNATATTGQPDELLLTAFGIDIAQTSGQWTAGGSATKIGTVGTGALSLLVEYQVVAAASAYTHTATITGTCDYAGLLAALKAG